MSDSHGSGLPNETGINTAGVSVSIILTLLMIPMLMAGVYGYFMRGMAAEVQAKQEGYSSGELAASRAVWDAERDSYGVVDQANSRYRIPLDAAKKLVVVQAREQREAAIAAARAAEEAAMMEGEGTPAETSEGAPSKNGDR